MEASIAYLASMNKQALEAIYEAFHYEMDKLEEDFQDGQISTADYERFKHNLTVNIETDLNELKREVDN